MSPRVARADGWVRRGGAAGLALVDGDVHVWLADLDQPAWPLLRLADTLSPDERERAERLRFPRDQRRFTVARGVLRTLLAGYVHHEPAAVRLRYGPRGKPELATPSGGPPIRFNSSRSQGHALYAFARGRRVGVDLEALRAVPEAAAIAERWLPVRERDAVLATPPDRRDEAFLRSWTCTEAYVKALGVGLVDDLEDIGAPLTVATLPTRRVAGGDVGGSAGWSLEALPPVDGYVAALVVEAEDHRLRCWVLDAAGTAAVSPIRRGRRSRARR
ncbi:MAG TPA: 4'-phosphopantetheinyl transferase superfamily protein [Egibacteraceae bacterium]|nr:4'-phosphopantetheinyl transferase superfamily protein [Egibacteraceae bacterium]